MALHITTYFLPESPRWLIAKDRHEEALKVLAKLHAGGDTEDLYVQAEYKEIIAKISFEKRHPAPSYLQLLFGNEWRRMWIGIGVVSNHAISLKQLGPFTDFVNSNSGNRSQESTCQYRRLFRSTLANEF